MSTKNTSFLPDSKIIKLLHKRGEERNDIDYDFIGRLNDFSKVVTQEVSFINALFPEYTPHDSDYHLKRLFYVAETILGDHVINNLNSAELFVLSASLFGHDWGMAVSETEKSYIISDQIKIVIGEHTFKFLDDELNVYRNFCNDRGINSTLPTLTDWQDYVRITHALRSGARIRKFFEKDGWGIGEAVARASEGHWLDFTFLESDIKYPIDYSVFREAINLRAISIYVRLIDLFDIGDDRTPYIIWKFVAPKNSVSKFEWAKHRSLSPITTVPYQGGRIIRVDGSTDNHLVYAALMDLKNYCSDQLRSCNDLLAYNNMDAYKLDIFHADWRINAIAFEPVNMQFDFDRSKVFNILSSGVYNDDKMVFLRELLQNSIDAIKVRKKAFVKKRLDFIPEIKISTKDEGDFIILKFSDNGSGMDEYIIKNYLSIAGKSYYTSDDFKKMGLDIDPISRFGIGILSCFMVSDSISIETCRDPYVSNSKTPASCLTIDIFEIDKQFRVKNERSELLDFGTIITLKIRKNKLDFKFDVFNYMSSISLFVDYPIYIETDIIKAVIIHPNNKESVDDGYEKNTLNTGIILDELIEKRSLEIASEVLYIKPIDLRNDLDVPCCEGTISFLGFKDCVTNVNTHGQREKYTITYTKDGLTKKAKIKFKADWKTKHGMGLFGENDSTTNHLVASNGIRIPKVSAPAYEYHPNSNDKSNWFIFYTRFQMPKICINFFGLNSKGLISVSRNDLLDNNWSNIYQKNLLEYKQKQWNEIFLLPKEKIPSAIGRFIQLYFMSNKDISTYFDINNVPICFVDCKGGIMYINYGDVKNNSIKIIPEQFVDALQFNEMLDKTRIDYCSSEGQSIFRYNNIGYYDSDMFLSTYFEFMIHIIESKYTTSYFSFKDLKVEDQTPFPFITEHCSPLIESPKFELILEKMFSNNDDLSDNELIILRDEINRNVSISLLINFPEDYKQYTLYGLTILNYTNPMIKNIIKSISSVLFKKDLYDEDLRQDLKEVFGNTFLSYTISSFTIDDLNYDIKNIFSFINSNVPAYSYNYSDVSFDIFVPNTIELTDDQIISRRLPSKEEE